MAKFREQIHVRPPVPMALCGILGECSRKLPVVDRSNEQPLHDRAHDRYARRVADDVYLMRTGNAVPARC